MDNELSQALRGTKFVNMRMLGEYLKLTNTVEVESVLDALKKYPDLKRKNIQIK